MDLNYDYKKKIISMNLYDNNKPCFCKSDDKTHIFYFNKLKIGLGSMILK